MCTDCSLGKLALDRPEGGWAMSARPHPPGDALAAGERRPDVAAAGDRRPDVAAAGERWRDALAELEYAEHHGAPPADVERLAAAVIAARIDVVQAGVRRGAELPAFLRAALERDRRLLAVPPALPYGAAAPDVGDGR
jgi:hypothetical protein